MTPAEEQAIRDRAARGPVYHLVPPEAASYVNVQRSVEADFIAWADGMRADVFRLLAEVDRLREEGRYIEEQLRQCREGPWA